MIEQNKCSKCNSENWICVGEFSHYYMDIQPSNDYKCGLFQYPVGYMECKNCTFRWMEIEKFTDAEYIGDDTDLEVYCGSF